MARTIEISDETAAIVAAQSAARGVSEAQLVEQWARESEAPAHQDESFERWVRAEIIPGHREFMADPSQGVPVDDVLAHIKQGRAARNEG